MKAKVVVKHPDPPAKAIERTVLAEAIVKIAGAAEELRRSGLNERAIAVLLADRSGKSITLCSQMLQDIAELRRLYCR